MRWDNLEDYFLPIDEETYGVEKISSEESLMVEAVVGPSSSLISKTLSEANFRSRYNLSVIAIHRKGKNLNSQMESLRNRYIQQFTSMEQAVTSLKSTGEYLTNLFETMNKDD